MPGPAAHAGLIDPNLDAVLRAAAPDQTVPALVYLVDRVDPASVAGHEAIVQSLRDLAAATQADLIEDLAIRRAAGTVQGVHPFWIANAIRVEATPAAIRAIAGRPDVDMVYLDYALENGTCRSSAGPNSSMSPSRGGAEVGVEAVRAPEVWAIGITGAGAVVAAVDTGADGTHEALASRWRGAADPRYADHPEWAWFDPVTETGFPEDFGGHGTHVTGTLCGGAPGDAVGVAPGAQWLHAATIARGGIPEMVSDTLAAFEWMIDPDGDPATTWDVPTVCVNGWGLSDAHGYPPCDETFWAALDACEAAGIMMLFSAGGEGPGGLTRPADRATDAYRTCAIGAVNAGQPDWPVASFSSRGPSLCTPDGDPAIKPDLAAPGVNVRSSYPGDRYLVFSGTSFAAAHAAGAVALVHDANQTLGVDEIKQIMYDTAVDLGPSGKDNAYGWGMVDAFAAVQVALERRAPGDVDGDGDADFDDVVRILSRWGPCAGCPEDLDGDGHAAFADLLLVLSNWTP